MHNIVAAPYCQAWHYSRRPAAVAGWVQGKGKCRSPLRTLGDCRNQKDTALPFPKAQLPVRRGRGGAGGRISASLTCSLARVPWGGRPLPALSPHAAAHGGTPGLRFQGILLAPEPCSGRSRSAWGRIPNPPSGQAGKLSAGRLPPPPPPPPLRQVWSLAEREA